MGIRMVRGVLQDEEKYEFSLQTGNFPLPWCLGQRVIYSIMRIHVYIYIYMQQIYNIYIYPPWNQHSTRELMVGILVSFWGWPIFRGSLGFKEGIAIVHQPKNTWNMSRLSMLNFWKSASWGTFALFICEDESVMALTYPFHSSPLDRQHLLKLMYFFSMSKKDSTKMPSPSSSMVLRFDLSTPILSMSHHVTSFIVKPRCDCWLV